MQILAALGVPLPGGRMNLDLVKHLLGLVDKLLGFAVFLRQLQQHMGLVLLQVGLGQQKHLFIDVLCLSLRLKSIGERFCQLQHIAAGLPVLGLAFLLPQLELFGKCLHAQTGKCVIRQANLPQKAELALHFPDHRLI